MNDSQAPLNELKYQRLKAALQGPASDAWRHRRWVSKLGGGLIVNDAWRLLPPVAVAVTASMLVMVVGAVHTRPHPFEQHLAPSLGQSESDSHWLTQIPTLDPSTTGHWPGLSVGAPLMKTEQYDSQD